MFDRIETTSMQTWYSPNIRFSFVILLSLFVFLEPIADLLRFSLDSDVYSYVPIIPLATVLLIYSERKGIFNDACHGFVAGGIVLFLAPVVHWVLSHNRPEPAQGLYLTLTSLCLVLFWIGGFVFAYGVRTFHRAMFPLLFLVLMVPLPDSLLDMVVTLLQRGSFWAAYSIFKMLGVDASSKEYVVFLPGLSIEVARQCSGIRSALSLFVTSLVAGHLFLKGPARKVILALASFPIAIFKNGLRIVVLSLGAIYMDEGFLSGPLHRRGGIVFFLLSLALLALTIWLLRRFGRPESDGDSN